VEKGCTSSCVIEAYERSLTERDTLIKEFEEKRWEMSPGDYPKFEDGIWLTCS
jgi:hypothetical protein